MSISREGPVRMRLSFVIMVLKLYCLLMAQETGLVQLLNQETLSPR